MARWRRLVAADDGFTLAELVMYAILSTIILAMVAGLAVTAARLSSSTTSAVTATHSGETASSVIVSSIRNATAFSLTTASNQSQTVVARVARGTTANVAYVCEAWFYDATAHTIRFHRQATGPVNLATAASWGLIASNVYPLQNQTQIFSGGWPNLTTAFLAKSTTGASTEVNVVTIARATVITGGTCV